MKKPIVLILILAMVMTLVACGNNNTTPTTAPKGTEASAQAPTETPTQTPTEPPTEPPTVPPTEPPTEPPAETPTEPSVEICPCGCGKNMDEIVWKTPAQWLEESGYLVIMPIQARFRTDYHIRLDCDFDVTDTFGRCKNVVVGQSNMNIVANVVLDLNGYTWSSDEFFFIDPGSTFTLLDTSAAQTGKMTSTGVRELNGSVISNKGTFNMYSGTLTMGKDVIMSGLVFESGGVFYQSGGVFNMYGGTIMNGWSDSDVRGGNVYIKAGEFNMYGGTIKGGKAAQGYNVWLEFGTVFNQQGGEIIADPADPDNSVYYNG